MTQVAFTKGIHGVFPADQETVDCINKLRLGDVVRADFKRSRNPQFHRKFFAMCKVAFDFWEQQPMTISERCDRIIRWCESKEIKPRKEFDHFRKWLVVMAGYYDAYFYPDSTVRVEAKSIAFGNMDDEEFEKVYSAVLDVILAKVVDMPREQYEELVDKVMEFA